MPSSVATAFLGLDYIVDIMHPDGRVARSAAQAAQRGVVAQANRVLAHARSHGWLVALVKVGFAADYADWPPRSRLFARARELDALRWDTPGTAFHPELDVRPSDLIVRKSRISAFYASGLDAALRARSIQRLVIAGVSTTWAVQSTARDAHDRDFEVAIVEDACASASLEDHAASIAQLSAFADIVGVDELLARGA